jgi:RNA polymerase-binding transcription factor DksA
LLAAKRAETSARVADLSRDLERVMQAAAGSNVDDEHDPEGATVAFERAQVTALLEQATRHIADLDRAAERVSAGTYGTCERCGGPIALARLEARPSASTCVSCAAVRGSR